MSNIPNFDSNNLSSDIRPEHHAHDSSEPLPGAAGGRRGPDYSTETTNAGFGGSARPQEDRLGDSFANTDTGFGGNTRSQDSRGEFGTTDTGFGGGARPSDRLGEFGNSGPETDTGIGRPAQVDFEDQTRGYNPSSKGLSASTEGRGENFGTEATTQRARGTQGTLDIFSYVHPRSSITDGRFKL